MQEVRVYTDIYHAEREIDRWFSNGWRVHTCAISSRTAFNSADDKVLVIYEKDD